MKALYARVKCLIYELNKLIPAPDSHLWPRSFGQETVVLTICFPPPPFISLFKKLFDSCLYKDVIC